MLLVQHRLPGVDENAGIRGTSAPQSLHSHRQRLGSISVAAPLEPTTSLIVKAGEESHGDLTAALMFDLEVTHVMSIQGLLARTIHMTPEVLSPSRMRRKLDISELQFSKNGIRVS